MTAPVLARWDDTRARIEAIRAALRTASTEQLHDAVSILLDRIDGDIAALGHHPAGDWRQGTLVGEGYCVSVLAGALGIVDVPR